MKTKNNPLGNFAHYPTAGGTLPKQAFAAPIYWRPLRCKWSCSFYFLWVVNTQAELRETLCDGSCLGLVNRATSPVTGHYVQLLYECTGVCTKKLGPFQLSQWYWKGILCTCTIAKSISWRTSHFAVWYKNKCILGVVFLKAEFLIIRTCWMELLLKGYIKLKDNTKERAAFFKGKNLKGVYDWNRTWRSCPSC